MSTKISYRKQWARVLIVDFVLLFFVAIFGFAAAMISEWLPILFCWGMILLFSAIPIILLAMASNNPLPKLDDVSQSLPWGIFGAVVMFVGYAILPTRYSDPTEQMYDLMCFGVGIAGIFFVLCYAMRQNSLLFLALFSPMIWSRLFADELLIFALTVTSLIAAGLGVYIWNRSDSPKKLSRSDYPKIEDVLAETEHLAKGPLVYQDEGNFFVEGMDDPDEWMAMLLEMAQQEGSLNTQSDQFIVDDVEATDSKAYVWTVIILLFVLIVSLLLILLMLL